MINYSVPLLIRISIFMVSRIPRFFSANECLVHPKHSDSSRRLYVTFPSEGAAAQISEEGERR